MADITMCKGGTCPFKGSCYRFQAVPNLLRQSYFVEIPFNERLDNSCEYYWQLTEVLDANHSNTGYSG